MQRVSSAERRSTLTRQNEIKCRQAAIGQTSSCSVQRGNDGGNGGSGSGGGDGGSGNVRAFAGRCDATTKIRRRLTRLQARRKSAAAEATSPKTKRVAGFDTRVSGCASSVGGEGGGCRSCGRGVLSRACLLSHQPRRDDKSRAVGRANTCKPPLSLSLAHFAACCNAS